MICSPSPAARTRRDACSPADFEKEIAHRNVIFRIPPRCFGAGLIEQIPDQAILANQANDYQKRKRSRLQPGLISSSPACDLRQANNTAMTARSRGSDESPEQIAAVVLRRGVQRRNGITNELFQTERDETPTCQFATVPTPSPTPQATCLLMPSVRSKVALFMRFLAPPAPSPNAGRGRFIARAETCSAIPGARSPYATLNTGNAAVLRAQSARASLLRPPDP